MMDRIPTPRPRADSRGSIALARLSGPLPTPADGFALDVDELARATEELLRRADAEGWTRDISPDDDP